MKLKSFSFKSYVRESWLQILLGLVCICLILASFFFPWWKITFFGQFRPWIIEVYPHGSYGELPVVGNPTNPWWFTLFTTGLSVGIVLSFLGSILKGKKGKVLLGAAGVLVLGIVYRFYLRILERAAGAEETIYPEGTFPTALAQFMVETGFGLGFRIAIVAGVACIASAIFLFVYERRRRKSLTPPPHEV